MKIDTPLDSTRLLISGLARQRARMLLTLPGLDRQTAVIPSELIRDDGYAFVTLLTPTNQRCGCHPTPGCRPKDDCMAPAYTSWPHYDN